MANWTKKKDVLDKSMIDALSGQISSRHDDIQEELKEHGLHIAMFFQNIHNTTDELELVKSGIDLSNQEIKISISETNTEIDTLKKKLDVLEETNSKSIEEVESYLSKRIDSCNNLISGSMNTLETNSLNRFKDMKEFIDSVDRVHKNSSKSTENNIIILEENITRLIESQGIFLKEQLNTIKEEHKKELDKVKLKLYITITTLLVLSILALK